MNYPFRIVVPVTITVEHIRGTRNYRAHSPDVPGVFEVTGTSEEFVINKFIKALEGYSCATLKMVKKKKEVEKKRLSVNDRRELNGLPRIAILDEE